MIARFRRPRMASLLLLVVASAASAADLKLPEFQTVELANGMKLYVAEDHSAPIVTLNVVIPCGRASWRCT